MNHFVGRLVTSLRIDPCFFIIYIKKIILFYFWSERVSKIDAWKKINHLVITFVHQIKVIETIREITKFTWKSKIIIWNSWVVSCYTYILYNLVHWLHSHYQLINKIKKESSIPIFLTKKIDWYYLAQNKP